MATDFTVNKADLEFILRQIRIAEATSQAYNPTTAISTVQAIVNEYGIAPANATISPFGLRTVDGSNNSLVAGQSHFGAADTVFPRLTDPVYRDETADEAANPDLLFRRPGRSAAGRSGQLRAARHRRRCGPAHHFQSDRRHVGQQSGGDCGLPWQPFVARAVCCRPSAQFFRSNRRFHEPVAPGEPFDPATQLPITNTDLQTIPNQSPDIGLSPGFNAWMTFFGQFFDHGLDLVTKGGNGTVYVPLQADDPLIAGADGILGRRHGADDLPAHLQFMALTRATPKTANGVTGQENTTTSFVDQNQTYTSHASHQVFLREYVKVDGKAVSTGKMLDGSTASGSVDGAIGNWAEVKAQALEMLGIILTDFDVHNVPLLRTDQYGKFIPDPVTGYAQVATATGFVSGVAGGLDLTTVPGVLYTNHAFLNDIAHHAAPGRWDSNGDHVITDADEFQVADSDPGVTDDGLANTYDDEMLNAHFVTGDGRGNENIALTTVHSIFHSEHNRLVDVNKATIAASALTDPAFVKEWLLNDATADMNDQSTWVWDGERLFQAARFGTEMQYQHMVFEEFARRIQPAIDPFIFNTSPNVDPSIVAEFAHTVYRFGHSMLTGTVDRLENDLTAIDEGLLTNPDQKTLLAVFLNPQQYLGSGDDLATINANLIRGLSRDVGNAMDEFIVTNVRSNLLGLPLDLAVLNLSRGRETGIPSLNQTREQLYNDTGLADLKPYTSWQDFALNIKNAASVINFIAAYGTHGAITAETTLAGKRAAAEEIVFGVEADGTTLSDIGDRVAFLTSTGTWAGVETGLNVIDLWIGGLAEKSPEFGGMLGTTFNYVFEAQMESLQFGDRFYYLTRTQGTNFLNNLEPNTFSDIVMRNTDLSDQYSTHLNGQLFVTPDHIIELDRGIAQTDYNGAAAGNDPEWDGSNPVMEAILGPKVVRQYSTDPAPYVPGSHDFGGYLRVIGGEHFVLGGTEGNDIIYGDSGMDTIWGDGGNDYLNGGTEADDVFGGAGDDIIEDPFGEGDVLRGNDGNDVVTAAGGADLLFGNAGQDYIVLGADAAEVFGGEGTDFILGGAGKDFLMGNEGSDWIEGGAGFDTIAGENTELFFNSPIIGHDVLFGHGDETDYDAESGDDIMASGPSVFRYEGMFGFDWGIGKGDLHSGVNFDLFIPVFTTIPEDILRDRFDSVEALSGWNYSDVLDGDDRGHKGGGSSAPDSTPTVLFTNDVLTQEGINRIDGFNAWFDGARNTLFGAATPIPGTTSLPATSYRDGNILMGGDGSDFLRGRGGYDLLDGDAYLNVRIKIVIATGPNAGIYSAESMNSDVSVSGEYAGKVYNTNPDGSPNFASVAFGGRSLTSLMLDRTINPGDMSIVREILYDTTPNDNDDTAIFQGTLAEYEIEGRISGIVNDGGTVSTDAASWRPAFDVNGDGFISVRDKDTGAVGAIIVGPDGQPLQLTSSRGALTDDLDLLKNVEILRFADKSVVIAGNNQLATGTVTIADLQNKLVNPADVSTTYDLDGNPATPALVTPYVGQVLTASLSGVVDADGYPGSPGTPTNVTFQWQTTETGGNAGWATIATGASYTVRSVDPGHILRAVALFQDNAGATEAIISAATDGATPAWRVDENSGTGTVVSTFIPFNPDYDPDQQPGGPTDGDIVVLTHVLADSAGGRFRLATVNGVQQVQVNNGGSVNLNYEVDNEYQIVIDSYIDAASAAALDPAGRIASRQFTVLLNNVEPEFVAVPPTDIQWNGVTPADGTSGFGNLTNGLPGAGATIANLGTADADTSSGFVYALAAGSSSGFAVSSAGVVTRTGSAMAANTTYTLNITSTDTTGGVRTETFTLQTGTNSVFIIGPNGVDTLNASAFDSVLYASGANDNLNGGVGNDSLYGQAGNDVLTGGAGNDMIAGGGGTDTAVFAGSVQDFNFGLGTGGALTVTDMTGAEGNDTLSAMETLRFAGVNYALVNGGATGTTLNGSNVAANPDIILGHGGNDTLNGNAGNDILVGGAGDDTVNGGAGNDTILWRVGDGRDLINGDTAAANIAGTTDTVHIAGDSGVEAFHIYSVAEAALAGITGLNANTEIVITRNGTNNASIIAELNNIEEIVIKGFGGPDTFTVHGTFAGTSLLTSTITLEGSEGDDTVDISALSSAHRIVFRSKGGNDTIIGNLRSQDVIELPDGATAADYTTTTDANGVSTMTNGSHTVTFTAPSGLPQVGNDDDDEDDDDNAGNDDDNDDTASNDDDDDDTAGNNDDNDDDDDDDDDNDDCGCDDDDDTDTTGGPLGTSPIIGGQRTGTPVADVLTGDAGDDHIVAFAGDDIATGNAGANSISSGEGVDFVSGGDGRDVIFAGAGDDQVFGGGQADVIYGDAGADRIFGEGGNDLISAGAGDDAVFGGAGDDLIVAEAGDGNDVYFGDDSDGGTGVDTLDMSAATANVTVNLGSGPLSNGTASSSQTGNDTIWGIENVNTGSGNDTITASNAVNVMNGGAGNDTYKFTSASAADGDTILGFEPGDRVDLTAIDTNLGAAGDQGFTLVSGAFTAVGQLAVTFETRADGDFTVVQGNTGGNNDADFTIEIAGHQNLTNANLGL